MWLAALSFATLALAPLPPLTPSQSFSTVVGPPEVMGGPASDLFDQPHLAIHSTAGVLGYTSNSASVLYSLGASIEAQLPTPLPVGLHADPSPLSYSHCGKWLNAAFVDAHNASLVHGFFHQEWDCDYAHNLYTNKSIGYALSTDGGLTFVPQAAQLIAGRNFSAASRASQCGEGDHGVLQLGSYLYLYFLEWDAPLSQHGGTSVGVARSLVSDAGRPGTWYKWQGGAWASPGVGGDADSVAALPGTAVYRLADAPTSLMAVGVMFSGPLDVAYSAASTGSSADPTQWAPAAAGPLFTAAYASWSRNANSSELFGYPALVGEQGAAPLPSAHFVYATYLAPGTDFSTRFLVRRPVRLYYSSGGPSASASATPPPALAALSIWACRASQLEWPTSGPVVPASAPCAYALAQPALALLATWAAPQAGSPLLELVECQCSSSSSSAPVLALRSECKAGTPLCPAAAAKVLRTSGWAAPTAASAGALGWGVGGGVQELSPPSPSVAAPVLELWRCLGGGGGGGGGSSNFSAAVGAGGSGCASRGWAPHALLGWALGSPVAQG
jgi:hypothetical protein